ncbi:Uncharacterised protein [Enterobacter cloacae]|uniref:Uncharacterized protein n=1 Tax=Enterobacter cloacae TaxID=550 RepID=A0A377M811_ENTCL|nr:hypothetical protein DR74_482 [Enterobacter cloacae]STQ13620.1 Uncharacterised protein [Enterobacter cloacae]
MIIDLYYLLDLNDYFFKFSGNVLLFHLPHLFIFM